MEGVAIKVRLSVAWPDGDLFGAGLRPHCPVDAAPRTSLRRSQQNHQRAPEFRIGKSTPRRAIRPTRLPPEPEEQADSERMSHRAHMGLCRRPAAVVALPCRRARARRFASTSSTRTPATASAIRKWTQRLVMRSTARMSSRGTKSRKASTSEITDEDLEAVAVEINPDHRHRPVRPA